MSSISLSQNKLVSNFLQCLDRYQEKASDLDPKIKAGAINQAAPSTGWSADKHQELFDRSFQELLNLIDEAFSNRTKHRQGTGQASSGPYLNQSASAPELSRSPPRSGKRGGDLRLSALSDLPRSGPDSGGAGGSQVGESPVYLSFEEIEQELHDSHHIRQHLQRKLQALRYSPEDRHILEHRIAQYASARRSAKSPRHNPRETIHEFLPDLRAKKLADKVEKVREHRDIVAERRKEVQTELFKKRGERVFADLQREEELRNSQLAFKRLLARRESQKRWAVVVTHATRISLMVALLQEAMEARLLHQRMIWAARRMQRWWRPVRHKREMERQFRAINTLTCYFSRYLRQWRLKHCSKAVNIIYTFLKAASQEKRMLVIIKRFRVNVCVCQKLTRRYLQILRAQIDLLTQYWERLEASVFSSSQGEFFPDIPREAEQPSGETKKPSKDVSVRKKKKKNRDRSGSRSHSIFSLTSPTGGAPIEGPVPVAIRHRIILRDLFSRRRAYRLNYRDYDQAMRLYEEKMKEWEQWRAKLAAVGVDILTSPSAVAAKKTGQHDFREKPVPPQRPKWKLLPTENAMEELIKEGYTELRLQWAFRQKDLP